jgi:energy-coupling factor transporter ATP-binding protein EcfA2
MTRVSEAVARRDQTLIVGRQSELATFRQWLVADAPFPEVLSITGPGGVGKSTLLHAFRRIAQEFGMSVLHVDGRDLPPTPQSLLDAIGASVPAELDEVIARLNDACPLVMLDTFEELVVLSTYLHDVLLPRLDTRVKLVLASRHPPSLAWPRGESWLKMLRPLPLDGFSSSESYEYLARRGIKEPLLARRVVGTAGGNPLALSLATDMVLHFNVRDFAAAPEWHLAVRSLAERVLHDITDLELRELLEACAVVHQFDEPTLMAISGRDNVSSAFDKLCQLSIVKASDHGLELHDDVRRHLAGDLSWRQPQRYTLFRSRAFAYYRGRLRSASPAEREWLVVECFFLWSNALIQQVFFSPGEPGRVRVEPRQPADDNDIRRLYAARINTIVGELGSELVVRPESDTRFLEAVLSHSGSRIRVARDGEGRLVGFSTVVPLRRESLRFLQLNPGVAALLRARWSETDLPLFLSTVEAERCFILCHVVHSSESAGSVRAALLRDFSGLFALGGTYLCSTVLPSYKALLEACGFERIAAAQIEAWGTGHLMDGYVLDLSRLGFERWIYAAINGRPLAGPVDTAMLERDLQAALQHWADSEWLSRSTLLAVLQTQHRSHPEAPDSLRELVRDSLTQERAGAPPDLQLAYRAVEQAYLSNGRSRKRAARNLAVSRATFYRLLKRGIRGLAEALSSSRD